LIESDNCRFGFRTKQNHIPVRNCQWSEWSLVTGGDEARVGVSDESEDSELRDSLCAASLGVVVAIRVPRVVHACWL
jgi:hypothetical protein